MARTISPDIIYEDPDIIVCRKPSGIPVQSARISVPDMVSILKNYLSSATAAGKSSATRTGNSYLAVVHRLDQPVEGLLVFAKTPAAAKDLNRQLTSHGFRKYYRAVVTGIPEPAEGTLEDYLVKDGRTNTSRVCTKDTPGAKQARLHYWTEEIFKNTEPATSRIRILLDTGRHHQIRVQMANHGCPLAGDRKYGKALPGISGSDGSTKKDAVRLCACRLEFRHPRDGRRMVFELPDES